ncbi:MAG: penicillin-binding transpeptidase domain-containing protein [Pyrinomonadaceae bacterium]
MKLMFSRLSITGSFFALAMIGLMLAGGVAAQSKKKAAAKKAVVKAVVAKKAQANAKDARKDRNGSKLATKDKNEKLAGKGKDPKKSAEAKRIEAERRRKEEERRQAILAERRRREQLAREARARKLAFERGLRTETVANISKDATEGEDLNIRAAAVNALGGHAGSVVVMEAQTGKILTIVNQDWAVRSSIRPCSTIKLVTATAALNEGVISKEDGSVRNISTRRNLDDAIAFSDNGYFQRAGSQLGNTKLVDYGRKLGLGEQTGINLDGEVPGRLPYNNNNARIYSHGDDTEVTTVQLAVMAAAITNGGHRVLPRIPRNNIEKADFRTFYKANVDLPQQNIRRVIPGMMGAAAYGTARRGMDQTLGVAGKTGSCIDKGSWVGLFASVAPIEKPKYAVAVITRGQGERGKYAAAVAGQIYRALATQIVRTDRNLAQTEFKIIPKTTIDPQTAARLADSEGDDDADNSYANAAADSSRDGRNVILIPSAPRLESPDRSTRKKLVTKTADSKPLFPPVVITYDKGPKDTKPATVRKPE